MTNEVLLLETIEGGVVEHGGDLGGWSRLQHDSLQLFDGRVTLHCELRDPGPSGQKGAVHAHVLATLHEYDDEVLDACLVGMGKDTKTALQQAAVIWITGVAGPIRSFLDKKPICMTCEVGVEGGDATTNQGPGDYGLSGLRAFVGPSFSRGVDERTQSAIDDSMAWFRYAFESAGPQRIHLAKVTLNSEGKNGWRRVLEIDGHDVSHQDPDWPAEILGPDYGYLTRFAVFEFQSDSSELAKRAELDRTIRYFAENFSAYETVDDLITHMVDRGFDADLVHEAEAIGTIAFGRVFFEPYGVVYASTIIRARQDGRIESDIPLMSIPAYSRARSIAVQLLESMPTEQFQSLCLYNAESNAILQAIEAGGDEFDLRDSKMYPSVVPDRDVNDQTMDAAIATLKAPIDKRRSPTKKRWWKFWA